MSGFDADREIRERHVWRRWFGRGVGRSEPVPGHGEPRLLGGASNPEHSRAGGDVVHLGHTAGSVLAKIEAGE